MRNALLTVLASALLWPSPGISQQGPVNWEPAQLQVTRDDLTDLMARYEAVAASSAYSGSMRDDAQRSAALIRTRLEQGDFRVGDRLVLSVEGEIPLDTIIIEPGPVINLPNMAPIALDGVLRSELQGHLEKEVARFVRDPIVRAYALIRVQIQGPVGQPGFHVFPADMLLSDAIMAAGGPLPTAKMDELRIERGTEVLLEDDEVTEALAVGRSLDQLNLLAGDILVIPADTPSNVWPTVIRWGAIITSSLLLGIRIF